MTPEAALLILPRAPGEPRGGGVGTAGLEVRAAAPSQHPLPPVLTWAWEQVSASLAEMRFWSHRLLQTQSTLLCPPDNKAIWIQRRCLTCPGAWVEFRVGGALPPPTEVQPGKASRGEETLRVLREITRLPQSRDPRQMFVFKNSRCLRPGDGSRPWILS